ncbi:MAG: alpha/beta fold hydrolase [Proteobacteria bacterium]|nr:alpha/beta fold hydrolase [Pseudomonadota bacterium]
MTELIRPDGATIHYQTRGSGDALLILGSDTTTLADSMSGQFTIITMDQRFEGRSRAPLAAFSFDTMLGDQLAVLDTLKVSRTCLIAEGLACSQALRLVYEAPARISAAALVHPPGLDASNSMDVYFNLFAETIRTTRAEGLQGVVDAALADPDFMNNPAGGPWAARLHDEPLFRDTLLSIGRETYISLMVDFRDGMFPWDRSLFGINDAALGRIQTPVLVVPGDSDRYPASVGQRIGDSLSNGSCLNSVDRSQASAPIAEFFKSNALLTN